MPKPSFAIRYRMSIEEIFWLYVNKDGPIHPVHGQCWEWIGGCFSSGYGQVGSRKGPAKRAHVLSWIIHNGPTKGKLVCHKCDNKKCVNPDHLFIGSHADNHKDRNEKGRQASGEKVWHLAKLTDKQVVEIRRRYKNRKFNKRDPVNGIKALSIEFGVNVQAIKGVVSGRTWKHLLEQSHASQN